MFIAARQSWRRLNELLQAVPEAPRRLQLPAPHREVVVETASIAPPGENRRVVRDVSFSLKAGGGLGVIGPSASGKSSLIKALVGIWVPARGKIRIDGASLDQWSPDRLGRHIGYLPQDVELFPATVAQNIARFDDNVDANAVIDAARAAGVHELITRLGEGYETQIGQGGCALSAGQHGEVTRISADTAQDAKTGLPYYTIRIAFAAADMKRLGEVKLVPGMPVEAFIQTHERTVLSYLVKPLEDQVTRAFREK